MIVRWDGWELDIPGRRIRGPAGFVHVEPQVFDVLAFLVEQRDRVVPKTEILDEVWGDQFVSESALTSRIKSIRRALGDDGRTQKYIRNVHARGYQFVGELETDKQDNPALTPVGNQEEINIAAAISLDTEFPFVGREDELHLIEADAGASEAAFTFIGGHPGVGKSRLAAEVLRRAASDGAIVCAGRCEENTTAALQPLRDAVAQLASTMPHAFAAWAEGLEGRLVALIPGLLPHLGAIPEPIDGYSSMDVLTTLISRAGATSPMVILIDDLQWSDEPTRAFASRLCRRLRKHRIRIVCTFRSANTDLPNEIRHWITDQAHWNHAVFVELGALDQDAAHRLAGMVLGADRDADVSDVVTETGGHSLFLTERLRDLQVGNSSASSLQQIVERRLDRLPEAVQEIVRVGAVLGAEFPFDVAASAAQLANREGLAAIDAGIDADLLHETTSPSRFRFSHQLIPEAVRSSMSRLTMATTHHRCVEALTATGADELDIAHHVVGAIPLISLENAVTSARQVAERAVQQKQFDQAIRLLERLLEIRLPPRTRGEVLVQIGWIGNAAGRAAYAATWFEEAADLGRASDWRDLVVDAALGHFGRSPYRKTLDTSTLSLLQEAETLLDPQPSLPRAKLLAKSAAFSVFTLPLATLDDMTQRALDMVPDAAPTDRIELLEYRSIVFSCPAGLHQLHALDDELQILRDEEDVYTADAAVPETRLFMLAQGAELRTAAYMDEERRRAQPIAEWRELTLGATLRAFAGDITTARDMVYEAGAIGEEFWGDSAHVLHALGHVFLGVLGGGWEPAIKLLDRLLTFDANQHFVLSAAWAHLAGGDAKRGRHLARLIKAESLRWHAQHVIGGNSLIAAAEVALLLGDRDLASAVEAQLRPYQELMLGVPWASSLAASDSLARLAAVRGDQRTADENQQRARDVYTSLDAPSLMARLENNLQA